MGFDRGGRFPIDFLNQMDSHLDFEPNGLPFGSENLQENRQHDHIPFNLKGNGNLVLSVCVFDICYWVYRASMPTG